MGNSVPICDIQWRDFASRKVAGRALPLLPIADPVNQSPPKRKSLTTIFWGAQVRGRWFTVTCKKIERTTIVISVGIPPTKSSFLFSIHEIVVFEATIKPKPRSFVSNLKNFLLSQFDNTQMKIHCVICLWVFRCRAINNGMIDSYTFSVVRNIRKFRGNFPSRRKNDWKSGSTPIVSIFDVSNSRVFGWY